LSIFDGTFIRDNCKMSRKSSLADHIVKVALVDMGFYDAWLNVISQPALIKVWMHILSEKRLRGPVLPKILGNVSYAHEVAAMIAKRVSKQWILRVLSPSGNWELPIALGDDKSDKLVQLSIGPYSSVWIWTDGIQFDTRPSCRWQSLDKRIEMPSGEMFAMSGANMRVQWMSRSMAVISNGGSYYLLTPSALKSIAFKSSPVSWNLVSDESVQVKLNNGDYVTIDTDANVLITKTADNIQIDQQKMLDKFPMFRDKSFRITNYRRYATPKGVVIEVSIGAKRYIVVGFRLKNDISEFADTVIEVGTDTLYVSESDPRIVYLDGSKRLCVVDGITGVVLMRTADKVSRIAKCEWESGVIWTSTELHGNFLAYSISPW
jgi:hypothetical protein